MDYNKLKDIIKESVNEAFMENGLVNEFLIKYFNIDLYK